MKIAISGATGFVGSHLTTYLRAQGHTVVPLGRADFAEEVRDRLAYLVAECDAAINLAGAPIDRRWNRSYRQEIVESRVETTRRLVDAVNRSERTHTFVSTSAVGCYPPVGCYDESSPERGSGFLARLCERWEEEARRVRVRCLITRFGAVLSGDGGLFSRLAAPARKGVAVVPGGGSQPFSWIDMADLVRAEEFLLDRRKAEGVYNFTAPETPSLRDAVRAVGRHCGARMTVTVPAFAVRMVAGEGAAALLDGTCAMPERLLQAGFRFRSPSLSEFLRRL